MSPEDVDKLQHRRNCPAARTEQFMNRGFLVTRCQDCGAQITRDPDGRVKGEFDRPGPAA